MDYAPLQYLFLYATAIFLTGIALNRETMLSYLVTGLWWLASALFSFILVPTGLGVAFGWLVGLLSFLFVGLFFYKLFAQYYDSKNARFRWEPY